MLKSLQLAISPSTRRKNIIDVDNKYFPYVADSEQYRIYALSSEDLRFFVAKEKDKNGLTPIQLNNDTQKLYMSCVQEEVQL